MTRCDVPEELPVNIGLFVCDGKSHGHFSYSGESNASLYSHIAKSPRRQSFETLSYAVVDFHRMVAHCPQQAGMADCDYGIGEPSGYYSAYRFHASLN